MDQLITPADVQAEAGHALTPSELLRIDGIIARVSAYIRAVTRRRYTAGTTTAVLDADGGPLPLDDATAVSAVRYTYDDGTTSMATGYVLRSSSLYGLAQGQVEVDYTSAGTVPSDVREIAAALAGRILTGPEPWITNRAIDDTREGYGEGYDPLLTEVEMVVLADHTLGKRSRSAMSVGMG